MRWSVRSQATPSVFEQMRFFKMLKARPPAICDSNAGAPMIIPCQAVVPSAKILACSMAKGPVTWAGPQKEFDAKDSAAHNVISAPLAIPKNDFRLRPALKFSHKKARIGRLYSLFGR